MSTENKHYFGEWVEYRTPEEKVEAMQFLQLWKKFFLRKISSLDFLEEQIIDRENLPEKGGLSETRTTLGIKICMSGKKPKNVLSLEDLPFY